MQKSKYNDVKFFLVAIAFISAFNYYLTWSNIKFNGFLILTYTIDTVEGWLAWWALRSIILYLDKRMPYSHQPVKRIIIQLVVTTAAGLSVIIALTEIVSWIARGKPALLNFYTFDIFIFIIWFFVLNGIYIGLHYYREWKTSEHLREEEKKLRAGGFNIRQGKLNLVIPFKEIMGFYSEEGYTYLQTRQDKKYLIDRSLDKTEESLPDEMFFRLNRQYLVHRDAISGFRRSNDGKLEVQVRAPSAWPHAIPVSRNRAVRFKRWFEPEPA